MAHIARGAETPNQRARQQQIIDAARGVLAREGLAACTARAVADASPLTKSAMHYYFRDIDEVIDRAMSAHLDALLDSMRQVAAREPDPGRRLERLVEAYLATFAGNPHAALLWFEYWIGLSRRGTTGPVAANLDQVRALLHDLLRDAHHRRPGPAAEVVLSWLLGAVVQQNVTGSPPRLGPDELRRLTG